MVDVHIVETCDVPAATAFDYVEDYRNTIKFLHGLTKYEAVGAQDRGLGAVYEGTMKLGPLSLTSRVQVVEWERDTLLASRSISGIDSSFQYRFTPVDAQRCQVDLTIRFAVPGGLAGKAADRAAAPFVRAAAQRTANNLVTQLVTFHNARTDR